MSNENLTPGEEVKLSKTEGIKEQSRGLYGPIAEDLAQPTPSFSDVSVQVLKHHGTYQQDDRDTRTERKKAGLDRDYKMMVRTKFPAGHLTWEQYLMCDELATKYGQDDLRITSRQDFQFHGVLKRNLRNLIHDLNRFAKITTFGGCGDVVRNTVGCPVADIDLKFKDCGANLIETAKRISAHFLPKTRAYYDLWLDDEKVTVQEDGTVVFAERPGPDEAVEDPIYGKRYLPRKFKIGVTADFDNSIDVYANDVGIIAVTERGRIVGYEVLAGGSMGYTHKRPQTYARLASHLGFVSEEELMPVVEAIVKVQRDFGGRVDRRHARLKYLIDDIGLDAFRAKVEEYYGKPLPPARNVRPSDQPHYLGWHKQIQDGLNYVGVWIENGRIRDFAGSYRFKSGLREIAERFKPDLRLTSHHNLILANIKDEDVPAVQALLDEYGIPTDNIAPIRRLEMACPALPLCGLAMSESERVFPDVIKGIEEAGHGDADVIIRMSGCPNNCSRPRSAEIGIVGNGVDRYHVHTGGDYLGTRLCEPFAENVPTNELAGLIASLLDAWKSNRNDGERFGDWSHRVGVEGLRNLIAASAR
jgi:sulfite reductase (ferredoxin)